jgi:hypothetical protein
MLTKFALKFLLPIAIMEDLIVMFMGGKSRIGQVLDKMFGKGTTKEIVGNVKKWAAIVVDFVKTFDLKAVIYAIEEDLTGALKDAVKWFDKMLPAINGVAAMLVTVLVAALIKSAVAAGALAAANGMAAASAVRMSVLYVAGLAKMAVAQAVLLATNPFTWIVIGIGLAVAAITWLWQNWDQVSSDFEYALNDLSTAFGDMWESVKTSAGEAWDWVIDKISGAVESIKNLVMSIPGVDLALSAMNAVGSLAGGGPRMSASSSGASGGVATSTTVNVSVPPGTPANVARAVGNAAAAGARRGNNSASLAAVRRLAPG